ncbi:hypothetical protein P171DRAFT_179639 [Karstenula rhodostoma CBS 690.94]|uniref:Uncharacterized protein n=1 Tax=Karstenula rhodostoma CBS 690.94 TaxID=1392251 RepID=A0A9P4U611_9PLEO|nr:hypothetical protein P171DRAFT_179639 [Karstenula rhodostoma CBS 690.94]
MAAKEGSKARLVVDWEPARGQRASQRVEVDHAGSHINPTAGHPYILPSTHATRVRRLLLEHLNLTPVLATQWPSSGLQSSPRYSNTNPSSATTLRPCVEPWLTKMRLVPFFLVLLHAPWSACEPAADTNIPSPSTDRSALAEDHKPENGRMVQTHGKDKPRCVSLPEMITDRRYVSIMNANTDLWTETPDVSNEAWNHFFRQDQAGENSGSSIPEEQSKSAQLLTGHVKLAILAVFAFLVLLVYLAYPCFHPRRATEEVGGGGGGGDEGDGGDEGHDRGGDKGDKGHCRGGGAGDEGHDRGAAAGAIAVVGTAVERSPSPPDFGRGYPPLPGSFIAVRTPPPFQLGTSPGDIAHSEPAPHLGGPGTSTLPAGATSRLPTVTGAVATQTPSSKPSDTSRPGVADLRPSSHVALPGSTTVRVLPSPSGGANRSDPDPTPSRPTVGTTQGAHAAGMLLRSAPVPAEGDADPKRTCDAPQTTASPRPRDRRGRFVSTH